MADFRPRRTPSRNRGFGRRDFRRRNFAGQDSDRQMYPATCTSCGQDCQVPFQPTGGKPVFCSNCFEKSRNSHRPQGSDQLSTLNAKLDKILALLESSPVKTPPKSKAPKSLPKKPIIAEENPPTPDQEPTPSE